MAHNPAMTLNKHKTSKIDKRALQSGKRFFRTFGFPGRATRGPDRCLSGK